MSLEHVLGLTKQIEGKLQALGATGRGLHEKATSIEAVLGTELTKRIPLPGDRAQQACT